MNSPQIDHSFFETKIKLREDNLPRGKCRILDCYSSTGRIWRTIEKRHPEKDIAVTRIDREKGKGGIYLQGDNIKFLAVLDLDKFDIIDLDSYRVPYKPLHYIFEHKHRRRKRIFATFIQSIYGSLPIDFLQDLGYPPAMVRKCPTLFYADGFNKLKQYLAMHGVRRIKHYSDLPNRKHYLFFQI